MEFWLQIRGGRIARAGFTTTGCDTSRAAGSMATELAVGKTVEAALDLEPEDILLALDGLPPEGEHCALLACNALQEALETIAVTPSA
jgi:nitrogen fixation NifU-like protein